MVHIPDGEDIVDLGGPEETSETGGYPLLGLSLKAAVGRGPFPMEISTGDKEGKTLCTTLPFPLSSNACLPVPPDAPNFPSFLGSHHTIATTQVSERAAAVAALLMPTTQKHICNWEQLPERRN